MWSNLSPQADVWTKYGGFTSHSLPNTWGTIIGKLVSLSFPLKISFVWNIKWKTELLKFCCNILCFSDIYFSSVELLMVEYFMNPRHLKTNGHLYLRGASPSEGGEIGGDQGGGLLGNQARQGGLEEGVRGEGVFMLRLSENKISNLHRVRKLYQTSLVFFMLAIQLKTLFVVRAEVAIGTHSNIPWREQSLFLALMLARLWRRTAGRTGPFCCPRQYAESVGSFCGTTFSSEGFLFWCFDVTRCFASQSFNVTYSRQSVHYFLIPSFHQISSSCVSNPGQFSSWLEYDGQNGDITWTETNQNINSLLHCTCSVQHCL